MIKIFNKNLSTTIRQERLELQEEIFKPATESFLSQVFNELRKMDCLPKKIFNLGCGIGSEAVSLLKFFPDSHIFAIEKRNEYIKIAKNKYSFKNLSFVLQKFENISELIAAFGYPDLIYWRMNLIHQDSPLIYLKNMFNKLEKFPFFAIEEPSVASYSAIPIDDYFTEFTKWCIQYDRIRNEDYSVGEKIQSFINELKKNIILTTKQQLLLTSPDEKQLIRFLVEDLTKIFSRLKITEKEKLDIARKHIIYKLVNNPFVTFNYYLQEQILFY